MTFAKLIPLIGSASLGLVCASCSTVPTVEGCSTLAERVLATDTPHPEIEDTGDELTDWRNLGLRYASSLSQANDRARTGLSIVQNCERRDAQITASQRSWNPFD